MKNVNANIDSCGEKQTKQKYIQYSTIMLIPTIPMVHKQQLN